MRAWKCVSTPAMRLSETALPAVFSSPAQSPARKHLSWENTPRPAGGIGQEVSGLPDLRRPLAYSSILLAQSCRLFECFDPGPWLVCMCWLLFLTRPPWDFLYHPAPYYLSPVWQGLSLPSWAHLVASTHLTLLCSSSVQVKWIRRSCQCQSFCLSLWTLHSSGFGSHSGWGH